MASSSSATKSAQTLSTDKLSKQHYVYNPAKPLSEAEQHVRNAGWPFVSTTILKKDGRLLQHRHHSNNTHFIIAGSIAIARSRDDEPRTRGADKGPGEWVTLPRNVDYIGEAGEDGCTFVEGHTLLSPTTAERYFQRGTIICADAETPGAFAAEDHA